MLVVGVVDPFVSSDTITASLKKYGVKSVAIVQRAILDNPYFQNRLNPSQFDEMIYIEASDSIEDVVTKCRKSQVSFVFNGFDHSMELTDRIANQLTPVTANDINTVQYRCDKILSQQILSEKGVQRINQLEIDGNELTAEAERVISQWHFPIVVKPANGMGTTGYSECEDINSLKKSLAVAQKKQSHYQVSSYLAQEKLIGQEWSIDTFSLQGKHHVLLVRQYQKEYFNNIPLPRQTLAVLPSDPIWNKVTNHVYTVLDSIGLKNGFCHTEVFSTNSGLIAIDINPRLPGASNASCILATETYGYSHVDVLCQVLLNKPLYNTHYQPGRIIFLQNLSPRVIDDVKVEKINELPSFKCCITNIKKGTMLSLPAKLQDTVAFVVLAHPNLQQIDRDAEKIFALEKNLELF